LPLLRSIGKSPPSSAEVAVELLGLGEIGKHEVEGVERVDAELAGALLHRLGHRADLGHGGLLGIAVRGRTALSLA